MESFDILNDTVTDADLDYDDDLVDFPASDIKALTNVNAVEATTPTEEKKPEEVGKSETDLDKENRMIVQKMRELAKANVMRYGHINDDEAHLDREIARKEADTRSVYVCNVDFSATKSALNNFFSKCGEVEEVTILKNKWSGQPKGAAFIEFADSESVQRAMAMDGAKFFGRQLRVTQKRTFTPQQNPAYQKHRRNTYPGNGRQWNRRFAPY
uniref:RRM domain-containing protein n=1 Tax=Panagrellus redivivus TaxID=6233 RepID=A0A7E4V7K0_PANRE